MVVPVQHAFKIFVYNFNKKNYKQTCFQFYNYDDVIIDVQPCVCINTVCNPNIVTFFLVG